MRHIPIRGRARAVVGVVHLPPLPGAPRWAGGSLDAVIDRALRDARTYAEGGVHALIVENLGDAPFHPGSVPAETVAGLAAARRAAGATPVVAGSGTNESNLSSILPHVDGVIVGTAVKVDGRTENPVDPGRIDRYVRAFRAPPGA